MSTTSSSSSSDMTPYSPSRLETPASRDEGNSLFDTLKTPIPLVHMTEDVPTQSLSELNLSETIIPKACLTYQKTPPLELRETEKVLGLDQQRLMVQLGHLNLNTTADANTLARAAIAALMHLSFQRLGSAFRVMENVPLPMSYGASPGTNIPRVDYMFLHPNNRHAGSGGHFPYMLMWILAPGTIQRETWETWNPPVVLGQTWTPAALLATRIAQGVRRQAVRHKCPQVCVFDGLTLLRFDFAGTTASQISSSTCPVTLNIVYDHPYPGRTLRPTDWVFTGPTLPAPNNPNASSRTSRSTIREVVFDSILTGLRRVCTTALANRPIGDHSLTPRLPDGWREVNTPHLGLRGYVRDDDDGQEVWSRVYLQEVEGQSRRDRTGGLRWMLEVRPMGEGELGLSFAVSGNF